MNTAKDTVLQILDNIRTGKFTVKWGYWFFSGGRTYGEGHHYDILQNGIPVYSIMVNEENGLDIRKADGENVCFELDEGNILTTTNVILINAVKRDDKELVKVLSDENGTFLGLPRDYGDISREDVLEGRWTIDYMCRNA